MAQMEKLESLPVPLASSQPDPSHSQRKLWTFHELTAEAETVILAHLDELEGRLRPRYRWEQEMQHLNEQEINRERLGLEPHALIAKRDILPATLENPTQGVCFSSTPMSTATTTADCTRSTWAFGRTGSSGLPSVGRSPPATISTTTAGYVHA
ncbi:hypothetical protein PJ267_09240 [Arthrobacter sp. OVS8]|nr:hypothetical protein PJ267_09240 [Arthrobacter sp. OVS8]